MNSEFSTLLSQEQTNLLWFTIVTSDCGCNDMAWFCAILIHHYCLSFLNFQQEKNKMGLNTLGGSDNTKKTASGIGQNMRKNP
jgi:hypothetical protein